MWGTPLSGPLGIIATVGRYPAVQLMPHEPIPRRIPPLDCIPCGTPSPWGISPGFPGLSPCAGHVAHALRTLPPVAAIALLQRAAPRLACVRPAASVHPEPGSNSSSYESLILEFCLSLKLVVAAGTHGGQNPARAGRLSPFPQ